MDPLAVTVNNRREVGDDISILSPVNLLHLVLEIDAACWVRNGTALVIERYVPVVVEVTFVVEGVGQCRLRNLRQVAEVIPDVLGEGPLKVVGPEECCRCKGVEVHSDAGRGCLLGKHLSRLDGPLGDAGRVQNDV